MNPSVVIVIPVYKPTLTEHELISLRQLRKVLSNYPVVLVCPEGLDVGAYRDILGPLLTRTVHFHKNYFGGLHEYNKLLIGQAFYKPFLDFEFMLLHHTDAFIFRDELQHWADKNYDNIGAPMYEFDGTLNPKKFVATGNGGLSLRKNKTFYEVAGSYRRIYRPTDIWQNFSLYNWKGRIKRSPYYLSLLLTLGSRMNTQFNNIRANEDVIWSYYVPKYFPAFRNAPFEDGYRFSMEFNCDKLLELNESKLPFGCHGWYKPLFKEVWRPYVEALGYAFV
jgi:hypothetical protein